jgi:shikimate kinase
LRLYLTGFMGAGKTTVGRCLAGRLDCPFVDLDAAVEERVGSTVGEVFERHGEAHFRRLEAVELRRTQEFEHVVVATGGGTPIEAANRRWMGAHGIVVWLDLPFERLAERLATAPGRPLWPNAFEAERLFADRRRFYGECDLAVEGAGLAAEEVAAEVLLALETAGLR